MLRVKVYKLNKDGSWDDRGTGNASLEALHNKAPGLVVVSEEDHRPLLVHRIQQDVRYNRQEDSTIISWTDPELMTELALSFQEARGCTSIWSQLANVQKEGSCVNLRRRVVDEFESGGGDREGGGAPGVGLAECVEGGNPVAELPEPSMQTVEELGRLLGEVVPFQRERAAMQVLFKPGFVGKVLELFRQCEDIEDQVSLVHVHKVVRGLVMLTDSSLLEEMLKEAHIMDVVGALEYDPEVPVHVNHREFLREKVVFKEVVPIKDPMVLAKIHQTYRILYLKDVVLPRLMDDQVTSTMTSLVMLNQMDIIMALDQDPTFLPDLFLKLKSVQKDDPAWHDLVAFLQEFCMSMKLMQPRSKQVLFSKLVDLGLYGILTEVMRQSRADIRLKATDIFTSAVIHDISSFRCFLGQQEGNELLSFMVRDLIEGGDNGLSEQFLDILRSLLDSDTMEGLDKHFLDVFYEKFMSIFVKALEDSDPTSRVLPSVKGAILELMAFCVQHHAYNIKYYFLRDNVLDKVVTLLASREKWLVVACIRFLRTCIAMKDDFYERYIVRNNLFQPVVDVFLKNGDRYNLLNSTVLELVDFIRKEKLKTLVSHLVDKYYLSFKDIGYVQTFQELKLEYDKAQEARSGNYNNSLGSTTGPMPDGFVGGLRRRRDARGLDREEEDYFSESAIEDEGDKSMSAKGLSPLPLSQRHYNTLSESTDSGSQNGHLDDTSKLHSAPLEPIIDNSTAGIGTSSVGIGSNEDDGVVSGLVDYDDDEDIEDIKPNAEQSARQTTGMKRSIDHPLPDAKRPSKEVVNCG